MTRDLLDDLLDRSAPATRAPRDADVAAMIVEARAAVPAMPRRGRRRSIAVTAGVLAAVLVSGAGVAAATGGFSWAPWAQDPLSAVAFSMSNGLDCEIRWTEYLEPDDPKNAATGGDSEGLEDTPDPTFLAEVNHVLEQWYREADVAGLAEEILPRKRAEYGALDGSAAEPEADPNVDERYQSWSDEWIVWDLAMAELEADALAKAGISLEDERLAGAVRNGQIQCVDESGDPYPAGSGQ